MLHITRTKQLSKTLPHLHFEFVSISFQIEVSFGFHIFNQFPMAEIICYVWQFLSDSYLLNFSTNLKQKQWHSKSKSPFVRLYAFDINASDFFIYIRFPMTVVIISANITTQLTLAKTYYTTS